MCSISRFLENLGPGMNPGVKGRMVKIHRNTISLHSLLQPKKEMDFQAATGKYVESREQG